MPSSNFFDDCWKLIVAIFVKPKSGELGGIQRGGVISVTTCSFVRAYVSNYGESQLFFFEVLLAPVQR
jgi:hypothetical protein